jgi:hypothetical protein
MLRPARPHEDADRPDGQGAREESGLHPMSRRCLVPALVPASWRWRPRRRSPARAAARGHRRHSRRSRRVHGHPASRRARRRARRVVGRARRGSSRPATTPTAARTCGRSWTCCGRSNGQRAQARGRVDVLLGNHEVMNLLGIYRDVNPAVYASFADRKSESRRERAYDGSRRLRIGARAASARLRRSTTSATATRGWRPGRPVSSSTPPRWRPDGAYGRWLREKPIALDAWTEPS